MGPALAGVDGFGACQSLIFIGEVGPGLLSMSLAIRIRREMIAGKSFFSVTKNICICVKGEVLAHLTKAIPKCSCAAKGQGSVVAVWSHEINSCCHSRTGNASVIEWFVSLLNMCFVTNMVPVDWAKMHV